MITQYIKKSSGNQDPKKRNQDPNPRSEYKTSKGNGFPQNLDVINGKIDQDRVNLRSVLENRKTIGLIQPGYYSAKKKNLKIEHNFFGINMMNFLFKIQKLNLVKSKPKRKRIKN